MSGTIRSLTVLVGIVMVLAAAVLLLGSVDRTTVGPANYSGWTGQLSASDQSDSAAMTPDDAVAVTLLRRAANAAAKLSFYATVTSSTVRETRQVAVTHMAGRGTRVTDGKDIQWLPAGATGGVAEAGKAMTLLATNFRVIRDAARDRSIAHRPAEAVAAIDSNGALVARFWIDSKSGLLVRKDTVSAAQRVVNTFEFTSLDIVRGGFAHVPTQQATWSPAVDASRLHRLRQAGCDCPDALPGNLQLVETHVANAAAAGQQPAIHQVFSDGIATVSLFYVVGTFSASDSESLKKSGFTAQSRTGSSVWIRPSSATDDSWSAVWEHNGNVATVIVSDAADDQQTLEMIVSAESPNVATDNSSWTGRMARGWQRLTGVLG